MMGGHGIRGLGKLQEVQIELTISWVSQSPMALCQDAAYTETVAGRKKRRTWKQLQ